MSTGAVATVTTHIPEQEEAAPAIRRVEILGALSAGLDITEGQPMGHAVRTCYIAMAMGDAMGLEDLLRRGLLYAGLLKDAGCSSNAARLAQLFAADEQWLKRERMLIDWTAFADQLAYLRRVAPGRPLPERVAKLARLAAIGHREARAVVATRCGRGAEIVAELGFPEEISSAVRHLDEHWDGKGYPRGVRGTGIPLFARILCLCQTAEVFATAGGPQEARAVVANRRGRWFDPELSDLFLSLASVSSFWSGWRNPNLQANVMARMPGLQEPVQEVDIDRIASAFARIVDAKSSFTGTHSQEVSRMACDVAQDLGLGEESLTLTRRAGLLHDLGKLGVPCSILDKPGRLTDKEWVVVKAHPSNTELILGRVRAFGRLAAVASAHHEKMEGGGYPRGVAASTLPLEARIIAGADVAEALSSARPYRPALPRAEIRRILGEMAGPHLDPEVVASLRRTQDLS